MVEWWVVGRVWWWNGGWLGGCGGGMVGVEWVDDEVGGIDGEN